jgi:hypothetical protein
MQNASQNRESEGRAATRHFPVLHFDFCILTFFSSVLLTIHFFAPREDFMLRERSHAKAQRREERGERCLPSFVSLRLCVRPSSVCARPRPLFVLVAANGRARLSVTRPRLCLGCPAIRGESQPGAAVPQGLVSRWALPNSTLRRYLGDTRLAMRPPFSYNRVLRGGRTRTTQIRHCNVALASPPH